MSDLRRMQVTHAQPGRIDWIGLRPVRLGALVPVTSAILTLSGLKGDHARKGKRALTLIQGEHLSAIAALAGVGPVAPERLRRNLVVSGINLLALRGERLRLGTALITLTAPCAPCSRMEAELGPGGWNAMRGHGGWCAEVLEEGEIALGDTLLLAEPAV